MKFETAAELYRHVRLQDIIPFALPADKKRLLIEAIDNYAKDYHESEVKNVSSNSCVSGSGLYACWFLAGLEAQIYQ